MDPGSLAFGVIGLAGLFSVCIDVLEKIDTYRDFDATSKQFIVRFEIERTRLQEWGEAVGIKDGILVKEHHPRLDNRDIRSQVERVLRLLKDLFTKTEHISDKVFGRKDNDQAGGPNLDRLELKIPTRTKIKGMFGSENRFRQHVENLEKVVECLDVLVPTNANEEVIRGMAEINSYNRAISTAVLYVNGTLQELMTDNQKRKEIEDFKLIADILEAPKISDPLSTQLTTCLDGTCDWIFHKTPYKEWLAPGPGPRFLWLHGPAGFGKTILCSRIIQTLKETHSSVFHFFASLHVQAGGKPEGIINVWLSDIASVDETKRALVLGNLELKSLARGLSSADLWKAWTATVANLDAIFVLDGFDEYQHNPQRKDFLKNLKDSLAQTQCRVLLTSRDQPDIRSELDDSPTLYNYAITHEDTVSDIRLYSNSMVKQKLEHKQPALKQELAQDLTEQSKGMFLWVEQCCRALKGSMNKAELKRIVKTAPKGLESAYERDWREISGQDDDYTQTRGLRILQWSMFAFRPLTISELTIALGVQESGDLLDLEEIQETQKIIDNHYVDENILDLSASLIDVKATDDSSPALSTVQLKHTSVREFLTLKMPRCVEGAFDWNAVSGPSHHLELAKVCLRFLCHDDSSDDLTSFRKYALKNWLVHSRGADTDAGYQSLLGTFLQSDSRNFRRWASHLEYPEDDDDKEDNARFTPASPLYFAALLGDSNVFHSILDTHVSLNETGGKIGTPLQAACVGSRVDLIEALLTAGADVNTRTGRCGTALCTAAAVGQLEAVRCLLSHGAAINEKGTGGASPLHYATTSEQNNIDMVRYLLNEGAEVNSANDESDTSIFFALRSGHSDIAKIFIEQGADLSIQNSTGASVIYSAAYWGRTEIVQLLLDRGVDSHLAQNSGWTPLNVAADKGHLEIVKKLVGADINQPSNTGWTPLNSAAESGHIEIVRELISAGANIDQPHTSGWTPLHNAAEGGHTEIVQMLIDAGAEINLNNNDERWTPLYAAVFNNHLEIVQKLIAAGADINKARNTGWTPLNSAAEKGHLDIVRTLINAGADLNQPNNDGYAPLNIATDRGHLEVVQQLIGADINQSGNDGWTPLNNAALSGRLDITQTLISAGAQVNQSSKTGWAPLHSAANKGHLDITQALISAGADVNRPSDSGWTPLKLAAQGGYLEIVQKLVSAGADVNQAGDSGWAPLHNAAARGQLEVMRILIGAGAEIDSSSTNDGRTPLMAAAYCGNSEAVALLLEYNANINAVAKNGKTPLLHAVLDGDIKTIQLLWDALDTDKETAKALDGSTISVESTDTKDANPPQPKSATKQDHLAHRTVDNSSLFHFVAASGSLAVFDIFVDIPNVADRDNYGHSMLEYACFGGHTAMVEKLLAMSPALFEATSTGWSLMHCACRSGNMDLLEILYNAGYRFSVFETSSPAFSWSPLDVASYCVNRNIVDSSGVLCEHPLWQKMGDSSLFKVDPDSGSATVIRQNSRVAAVKSLDYYCDGCEQSFNGVRYECRKCEHVDYCFMCKGPAEHLHQGHGWKVTNLGPEDYDDPDAEKPAEA